ncbi:CidA/LrgA family protein [Novosphingobium sp. P6W]|uniref:CidA/LrgA family protein n=1 Tax=Novosphingobium sp. P6W TaxID=1609758 RepID=UPI0005C2D2B9|nr:CidA/LrgA family protein [Novosphingobium sp. P6W]AXB75286.1 CidA/LrgA family protein [Novosphingobium sp. P6W]KIS32661.1 murein hydrolase transporter LrgA [Novosphingobium sp. P6W]
MLHPIFLLLACQLAGEAVHRLTGLALPGTVIGMMLLVGWLATFRAERPALVAVTGWLTAHLAIMFVPACVGLIDEGALMARYGIGLIVATAASMALTLAVTALVFRWALVRFVPEDGTETGAKPESIVA